MIYILIVLFLHCLFVWLYGDNKLYCGLFGGCFDRPIDKAILDKLITLGFINQSRGEDGCGYYNGDKIYKGTGDVLKRFTELFVREGIKLPENEGNNVFIGHARKATRGDKTETNTHPFESENLIVAHNGTIDNIWTLTNKHGIDSQKIFSDSYALTLLLDNVGYNILDSYSGYAALLIHKKNEPNSLYIYHGSSKSYEQGTEQEERPLFYLKDTEGIYVSSMKEALELIRSSDELKVETVPHNRVMEIKNGKFGLWYPVNRGNSNVKNTYRSYNNYEEEYPVRSPLIPVWSSANCHVKKPVTSVGYYSYTPYETYTDISGIDINEETPDTTNPNLMVNNMLYWHRGRYYITRDEFKDELANGMFIVDKDGMVLPLLDMKGSAEERKIRYMYFYKGVLLKSQNCYNTLTSLINSKDHTNKDYNCITNPAYNFAYGISKYAKYPVFNLPTEGYNVGDILKQIWWMDTEWASGEFEPVFCNRKYKFKGGHLIKISAKSKEDTGIIPSKGYKATLVSKEERERFENPDTYENIVKGVFKNGAIKIKSSSATNNYISTQFFKVFRTVEEAVESLGDIGLCAISLYSERIFETILGNKEPSEKQVENLSLSIITDAVEKRTTILKIMDSNTIELDKFITSAKSIVEQENKTEEEYNIDAEEPIIDTLPESKPKQLSLLEDPNFNKLNQNTLENNEEQIIALEKEQEENEKAANYSEEILEQLNDLWKTGIECQLLNNSDFAQDVFQKLSVGIDKIQSDLKEVFRKHKQSHLVLKTNQQISQIF